MAMQKEIQNFVSLFVPIFAMNQLATDDGKWFIFNLISKNNKQIYQTFDSKAIKNKKKKAPAIHWTPN